MAMIETVVAPETGMHLIGWLPDGVDDQQVAQHAAVQNVYVLPISSLAMSAKSRSGLALGYAGVNKQEIQEGIARLSVALREVMG